MVYMPGYGSPEFRSLIAPRARKIIDFSCSCITSQQYTALFARLTRSSRLSNELNSDLRSRRLKRIDYRHLLPAQIRGYTSTSIIEEWILLCSYKEQANGTEVIEKMLALSGYTDTFDKVYDYWTIANYLDDPEKAGGKYGYETLEVSTIDTWGYSIEYVMSN